MQPGAFQKQGRGRRAGELWREAAAETTLSNNLGGGNGPGAGNHVGEVLWEPRRWDLSGDLRLRAWLPPADSGHGRGPSAAGKGAGGGYLRTGWGHFPGPRPAWSGRPAGGARALTPTGGNSSVPGPRRRWRQVSANAGWDVRGFGRRAWL